jgi:hypothetical protein
LIRGACGRFPAPILQFAGAILAPLTCARSGDAPRLTAPRRRVAVVPADSTPLLIDTAAASRAPLGSIVPRNEKEDKDEQFIHELNWQKT